MNFSNKFQSFTILFMIISGIILGQISFIQKYSEYFIMPSLTIMLFLIFLQVPLKNIAESFKNIKFTITAVVLNFIFTPMLVFILSKLFLNSYPELLIGFVMLMVTPCTDWYIIFTGLAKGNIALSSSILPLNLILQLILLPIYILLIANTNINIDMISLSKGIIFSLVIPLTISYIFKIFIKAKTCKKLSDFQGYFLNIAIICMFAFQGKILLDNYSILFILLIPILLFFIFNFIIGRVTGKVLNFDYSDSVSLSLTTLARNSPIALAIAISAFPTKPLIALALVIGPLIELPILFIISKLLLKLKKTS